MNIINVLVINSGLKYKLGFDNEQLEELSKILAKPSERNMVNYLDNDTIEDLDNSNKYYINGDDNTESYQLDILKKLITDIPKIPILKSIDDIFQDDNLKYSLIGYLSEEENGNQELFLYQLKKVNLVKDNSFFIFNKKIYTKKNAASQSNSIKVEQVTNGFNLPTSGCLASIYKRRNSSEGNQYKAKIYRAYNFDEVFQTSETKRKYVERNIQKFESSISLILKDNVSVSFEKANIDTLKKVIYSDDHLTKTFCNYHDTKTRKIKKIKYESLEKVLNTLKTYVKNNADAEFEIRNIPILKDMKLEVTEDSVPIFAALLDNKVIQRLLDNKIEIPYFKRHLNK